MLRTVGERGPARWCLLAPFSIALAMAQLSATAQPTEVDRPALVAFYEATDGANWTNNTNWLSSEFLDEWYGVDTDAAGRVTSLSFFENQVAGPLPDALASLTNLATLKIVGHSRLGDNVLTGPIPGALDNLTNLQSLNLAGNRLTGPVPDALGNLTNLTALDLDGNRLTGQIPDALGNLTNLTSLQLSANQLTGRIPDALGKLTNLTSLAISATSLTGPIPNVLGNLTKLTHLFLSNNLLTGVIPESMGNLTSLRFLNLHNNRLRGPIPSRLGNLTVLASLFLDGNPGLCLARNFPVDSRFAQLAGEQGISVCSAAVGDRAVLEALYHATGGPNWTTSTNWNSELPINWWAGVHVDGEGRVTGLDLRHNGLTGQIPAEFGGLARLEWVYVGSNALAGPIPATLGQLPHLRLLGLADNQLSGSIPAALGQLPSLESLYLEDNRLTGSIPAALGSLSRLEQLFLGGNLLAGRIPAALGNLTNLTELDLDRDTGLCLAPNFPLATSFARLAERFGISVCEVGFTDDPVVAGTTAVRAVHFEELRARIDELRVTHGLDRFSWTNSVPETGVTPIEAVHLSELRTALREAYMAAGRTLEFDAGRMQPGEAIRAAHVNTLRRAIEALE